VISHGVKLNVMISWRFEMMSHVICLSVHGRYILRLHHPFNMAFFFIQLIFQFQNVFVNSYLFSDITDHFLELLISLIEEFLLKLNLLVDVIILLQKVPARCNILFKIFSFSVAMNFA